MTTMTTTTTTTTNRKCLETNYTLFYKAVYTAVLCKWQKDNCWRFNSTGMLRHVH